MSNSVLLANAGQIFSCRLSRSDLYFAVQVTSSDETSGEAHVLLLDWLRERPPEASELTELTPWQLTHYNYGKTTVTAPNLSWGVTSKAVPPDFKPIGTATPLLTGEPDSYFVGWDFEATIHGHLRWQKASEEARSAYLTAPRNSGKLDFGAFQVEPNGPGWRLTVQDPRSNAHQGSINWNALHQLPCLSQLNIYSDDCTWIDTIEAKSLLTQVRFEPKNTIAKLDLSKLSVQDLSIGAVQSLTISDQLFSLTLESNLTESIHTDDSFTGNGLSLSINCSNRGNIPDFKLPELEALTLFQANDLNLAGLKHYPNLKRLTVRQRRGKLTSMDAISELKRLQKLEFFDVYHASWDDMTTTLEATQLYQFTVMGFAKSEAKALKKWAKVIPVKEFRQARSEQWISENADNPFGHWIDHDERAGNRAMKTYSKAKSTIRKLKKANAETDEFEANLTNFMETFNKIHKKQFTITTLEREQVLDAFCELAAESQIDDTRRDELFSIREF